MFILWIWLILINFERNTLEITLDSLGIFQQLL